MAGSEAADEPTDCFGDALGVTRSNEKVSDPCGSVCGLVQCPAGFAPGEG